MGRSSGRKSRCGSVSSTAAGGDAVVLSLSVQEAGPRVFWMIFLSPQQTSEYNTCRKDFEGTQGSSRFAMRCRYHNHREGWIKPYLCNSECLPQPVKGIQSLRLVAVARKNCGQGVLAYATIHSSIMNIHDQHASPPNTSLGCEPAEPPYLRTIEELSSMKRQLVLLSMHIPTVSHCMQLFQKTNLKTHLERSKPKKKKPLGKTFKIQLHLVQSSN